MRVLKKFLLSLLLVLQIHPAFGGPLTYLQKIRAQAGLVRYHTMAASDASEVPFGSDIGFLMNGGQTNPTPPVLDTGVTASGQPSLKFTIPGLSSAGASGQWTMRFASDNSTQFGPGDVFYVQWEQKFDRFFIEHTFTGGGGWKQGILGNADGAGCTTGNTGPCASSCTILEIVPQNTFHKEFMQMYNSCPADGRSQTFEIGSLYGSDIDMQPRLGNPPPMGQYCSYQSTPTYPNCKKYADGFASGGDQTTQWGTFTMRIFIGPKTGSAPNEVFSGSNVKTWVSWGGATAQKIFDYDVNLVANGSDKYGRVWLLPYNSGKSAAENHITTYTWYANVIVATQPIPLETADSPESSTLYTLVSGMTARTWGQISTPVNINTVVSNQGGAYGSLTGFSNTGTYDPFRRTMYFLGGDHMGGMGGDRYISYTVSNNTWTTVITDPNIGALTHGYDHNCIDPLTGDSYQLEYGAVNNQFRIFKKATTDSDFSLWLTYSTGVYFQVANGFDCWTGKITGGGKNGNLVVWSGGSGTVYLIDIATATVTSTNDFVSGNPDHYHGSLIYNPYLNSALILEGDGNSGNPKHIKRLNADFTVDTLSDSPIDLGVRRSNVVVEPISHNYLFMGENKLYLYDSTGSGTATLLNGAGDAIPTPTGSSGVGDPSVTSQGSNPYQVISFASDLGAAIYVTGFPTVGTMYAYKYADSSITGNEGGGGGGTPAASGVERRRRR